MPSRRPRAVLLVLLALIALAACHDSTAAPFQPTANVAGLWTVQTVNGLALPVTVQQIGANKEELLARVYALTVTGTNGGVFTQTATQRFTQNGQISTVSASNTGTFTVSGAVLHFSYDGTSATDSATWDGHDTLHLVDGPNVSVLTR